MTRDLTLKEYNNLTTLHVEFPESGQYSVPFSISSHVFYKPTELLCKDGIETARTVEFVKRFVALHWILGDQPVPYVFRTSNGSVRSMDAGCLGMLHSSSQGLVEFVLDPDGFIIAANPTEKLKAKYDLIKKRLVKEISV